MRIAMRERRTEMGKSQEDIARLAGLTASGYAKIERGEKNPSVKVLLRLSSLMGLDALDLLENGHNEIVPAGQ